MKKKPLILAIDTSCDETSASVNSGRKILSNIISSQVELHKKWGGVVPDIARRAHEDKIEPVVNKALKRARIELDRIDYISVTQGPGLAIALEIGLKYAQNLALKNQIPLIPINHIEAHLLSPLALNSQGNGLIKSSTLKETALKTFPALGVVISGGHTSLIYIKNYNDYQILGETLDDAVGECFDKVARMLNLGYPGGPIITSFAKKYRKNHKKTSNEFELPTPMKKNQDYNFSYSGLKTACLYTIKDNPNILKPQKTRKFCNEFLNTVIKSLEIKIEKALKNKKEIKSVLIGGGVSNNEFIIRAIGHLARNYGKNYYYPPKKLRTDNAAMIGLVAYIKSQTKSNVILKPTGISKIDRRPQLSIT